jgi:hypothetical protein
LTGMGWVGMQGPRQLCDGSTQDSISIFELNWACPVMISLQFCLPAADISGHMNNLTGQHSDLARPRVAYTFTDVGVVPQKIIKYGTATSQFGA